jgi:hypothetical protein
VVPGRADNQSYRLKIDIYIYLYINIYPCIYISTFKRNIWFVQKQYISHYLIEYINTYILIYVCLNISRHVREVINAIKCRRNEHASMIYNTSKRAAEILLRTDSV